MQAMRINHSTPRKKHFLCFLCPPPCAFCVPPEDGSRRRAAFSLVEMLIVVSIISLLLGMLYSAIRSVQRYSRESITRGELKNIEAAWKQYYGHYLCWPTGTWSVAVSGTTVQSVPTEVDGDLQYTLEAPFARMLEGQAITNDLDGVLNGEAISFLELTRFDSQAAPINAWGSGSIPGRRYYVMFDIDGDNRLRVLTNTVFRPVAVWTDHPERDGRILGSWER